MDPYRLTGESDRWNRKSRRSDVKCGNVKAGGNYIENMSPKLTRLHVNRWKRGRSTLGLLWTHVEQRSSFRSPKQKVYSPLVCCIQNSFGFFGFDVFVYNSDMGRYLILKEILLSL